MTSQPYSPSPHSVAAPSDLFFLDDAALPTLQRLTAESDFTSRGFLQHTGNSLSRTGQAVRNASTLWVQILDSTSEAFGHHLSEIADFVHTAFRADANLEAAL